MHVNRQPQRLPLDGTVGAPTVAPLVEEKQTPLCDLWRN